LDAIATLQIKLRRTAVRWRMSQPKLLEALTTDSIGAGKAKMSVPTKKQWNSTMSGCQPNQNQDCGCSPPPPNLGVVLIIIVSVLLAKYLLL